MRESTCARCGLAVAVPTSRFVQCPSLGLLGVAQSGAPEILGGGSHSRPLARLPARTSRGAAP
eukprot:3311363-Prymnesium_polylepis.1